MSQNDPVCRYHKQKHKERGVFMKKIFLYIFLISATMVLLCGCNSKENSDDTLNGVEITDVSNADFVKNPENYKEYNFSYGGKRYVRVINGLITNDFYQVAENGYTIKSPNTFTKREIRKLEREKNVIHKFSGCDISVINDSLNVKINLLSVEQDQEIYFKVNDQIYHLRAIKDAENTWYIDFDRDLVCTAEIEFY